ADLDTLQKRHERVSRMARVGQKEASVSADALAKAVAAVEAGMSLRAVDFNDDERAALRELSLLTMKPVLYVANVAESDLGGESEHVATVRAIAAQKGGEMVVICGELEAQIARLVPEERNDFLGEMGLSEPGLDVL